MDDCIVIKFGGGLITDKSTMCTPNNEVIDSLVNVVADCLEHNLRVIVVHGAGSFGHLRAKYWKLNQGYLVVRICQDIPNVKRLIFAVKGVDGILKRPPELADESDLIKRWSPSIEYSGVHNSEIDVTGGIGLKAIRGSEVAAGGVDVFIINGEEPQRLLDACKGISTRGTQIFAE